MSNRYQQRLKGDLERWVTKGWVQRQYAGDILNDAARAAPSSKIPMIVGILGAILIAAGVVLFVSANWQEMSKLARLVLLMGAMWFTFAIAVWLNRTSHKYMLEAVLMLAAAIFGANIMLIAQLYHIDNHYPDGIALWGTGSLLTALFLRSRAALVLAFGLIVWWAGSEILDFGRNPFWPFLPVWAVAAVTTWFLSFRFGLHLAFLSLMAWLISSLEKLFKLFNLGDNESVALMVLFLLVMFIYGLLMHRKNPPLSLGFGRALARYGISGFMLLAFATQSMSLKDEGWPAIIPFIFLAILAAAVIAGAVWARMQKIFSSLDMVLFLAFSIWFSVALFIPALFNVWLQAAIFLALAIWLLMYGQTSDDRGLVVIALLAFGIEVIYLYVETLGSLLDTSVFFLLGGVLLVALSFGLETFRRFLKRARHKTSAPTSARQGQQP